MSRAYVPLVFTAFLTLFLMGCHYQNDQYDTSLSLATPPGYAPAVTINEISWEQKATAAAALSAAEDEAPPAPTAAVTVETHPVVAAVIQPQPVIRTTHILKVRHATRHAASVRSHHRRHHRHHR